jgi:hypothetical protein
MLSRVVTLLTLSISPARLAVRAEVSLMLDPARFHESASVLDFEDLGAGSPARRCRAPARC